MQKTCEKELIIGFTDVDFKERLRPFRAFELLEDLADMHAEQLGIGMESPIMEGYAWVVARNHVQLFSMPKLGQTIKIITWPGERQRMLYPRLFKIENEEGKCIGGAYSIWTLLDRQRQRLASHPQINALFPDTSEMQSPVSVPKKLKAPVHTRAPRYYTPAYSDLDRNRHVNNARYISWICDCFDPALFEEKSILDLEINYVNQAFAGQTVRMDIGEAGDSFLIQGVNDESETVLFRAEGRFIRCQDENADGAVL